MGAIWNWIEKDLSPPGIHQKNRRRLYRIAGRIAQQVADDIAKSKREFFAYTTSRLDIHGKSKNLPRFPFDTDDSYRMRLVSAADELSSTGEELQLAEFLNSYVPGRWLRKDATRDYFLVGKAKVGVTPIGRTAALVLYVFDLIPQEKQSISAFLDWFLGPDIEFVILREGINDVGALERFMNSYVPERWRKTDRTVGFFHVGAGDFAKVGVAKIADETELLFEVDDLTATERQEIEDFLEWFFAETTRYILQAAN